MTDWLSDIKKAKKSCIAQGNLKKVHYELPNEKEMVEEYNTDTGVLTRRAWRRKTDIGGEGEWDIEIGDPEPNRLKDPAYVIKENPNQPFVTRRITKLYLEWRIRNLPYPLETYQITADPAGCLVIRTTNKKYFKKLDVPELERAGLAPEQGRVHFTHKYNTLIITYKKPKEVLDLERAVYDEVQKLQPTNGGDANCKLS